jgi:hypothetical protein
MQVSLSAPALAAFALVLTLAASSRAEPEKCRAAVIKASAAFVKAEARALRRCREQIVRGSLPQGTDCRAHLKTANALSRAADKLRSRVTTACGGRDRTCGTTDDDPLAEIGWGAGTCPFLTGTDCDAIPVASCADVAACLECIGDGAVGDSVALAYGGMAPTDPKLQKGAHRCQLAIGRSVEKLLVARSKALARCWTSVNAGKADAPCPDPGDGKALSALSRAEEKTAADICKACGGRDGACATEDDEKVGNVGFASECPVVSSCWREIDGFDDIVGCIDCVAELKSDCADRNAVPGLAEYPVGCYSAVPPPPPPPPQVLNFSLPPVYGSTALTSGFVPDPFSVGLTAGGPVNASYLGGGCSGFATSAPSFSVNYTSGVSPTLRFYFIGGADTTMIVNSPTGSYFCVNDSFGTPDPTLDFNAPLSGRYDVWIATVSEGASTAGTLYVTQSTGNHP